MPRKSRRVRIAEGVFRDRGGLAATIKVGGLQREKRFPKGTPMTEIQQWRREEADELRKDQPTAIVRGTFGADVESYLRTLADRPRLQSDRAMQLGWWADQTDASGRKFRDRRRRSLEPAELRAAIATLGAGEAPRAASTIRHYRTALFHLFSTLDGKQGKNPLRDIVPPRSADPEPRAIPYPLLDAILAAIPIDGWGGRKLTPAAVVDIRRRLATGESASAIGRVHGVSETMVRKIRSGRWLDRSTSPFTRLRLAVIAYTGLPHAQVEALRPDHVNWDEPSVLVQGRKKGRGSRTVRLPLTPPAVTALRAFFAAGAQGPFSRSAMRVLWWRGIRAMVDELAARDYRTARETLRMLERMSARPYDARHSFLTEAMLATGNLRTTQSLAQHADIRQTQRYTLAAVAPELAEAARLLADRFGAQARASRRASQRLAHKRTLPVNR